MAGILNNCHYLNDKQAETALRLREEGYQWTVIGQRFGLSAGTVKIWVDKYQESKVRKNGRTIPIR